jgi:hypothetical protein
MGKFPRVGHGSPLPDFNLLDVGRGGSEGAACICEPLRTL